MTTGPARLFHAVALVLATASLAVAAETTAEHERENVQTITLDTADLRPETLTMSKDDRISFVNSSTQPFHVTFVEPKDIAQHIRCGLVRPNDKTQPSAPWALFVWRDGRLEADIPPGQFASVCSLEPGTYAFTAERIGHRTPSGDTATTLPLKGQIEVK